MCVLKRINIIFGKKIRSTFLSLSYTKKVTKRCCYANELLFISFFYDSSFDVPVKANVVSLFLTYKSL